MFIYITHGAFCVRLASTIHQNSLVAEPVLFNLLISSISSIQHSFRRCLFARSVPTMLSVGSNEVAVIGTGIVSWKMQFISDKVYLVLMIVSSPWIFRA